MLFIIFCLLSFLIFVALQRKYSPQSLINGFMSQDKAEEVAPEFFKKEDEK